MQTRDNNLLTLPNEMILIILAHLELHELAKTGRVCKSLEKHANHGSLWQRFFAVYYFANTESKDAKFNFYLYRIYDSILNASFLNRELLFSKHMRTLTKCLHSIRHNKNSPRNRSWTDYLIAKKLACNTTITPETFNKYLDSAREMGNTNTLLLEYSIPSTSKKDKEKLLKMAHEKGNHHATLLLAKQISIEHTNIQTYLKDMIIYLELVITAANRGNISAIYTLATLYRNSIDNYINLFRVARNPFSILKITPCTEQEWQAFRDMLPNATRADADKHFEIDREYKKLLLFNPKKSPIPQTLIARKEHANYWYQKAIDKRVPGAQEELNELSDRDLANEYAPSYRR